MKCDVCASCLRPIRIDFEDHSEAYWYCDFCLTAYPLGGSYRDKINDTDKLDLIKKRYDEQYDEYNRRL